MPNRDKTGPEGQGPNTGRGAGDCNERYHYPRQNSRWSQRQTERKENRGRRIGRRHPIKK